MLSQLIRNNENLYRIVEGCAGMLLVFIEVDLSWRNLRGLQEVKIDLDQTYTFVY